MKRIEEEVHAHFAETPARDGDTSSTEAPTVPSASDRSATSSEIPFANVNSVVPSSPADAAGMKAGDHVVRFGTVNWMNNDKLAKLAEVVTQNEGVLLPGTFQLF